MPLATIAAVEDIANLAMDLLSEKPVSDIETPGNSLAERVLNRQWHRTRREILRAHPWNIATKRSELVELGTAPDFGWASQYTLPSDFLRALTINGIDAGMASATWKVEQTVVVMDQNAAKLVYVFDLTDVTKMEQDALFIDCFAHKLAINCLPQIKNDYQLRSALLAEYKSLIESRARKIDSNEDRPRVISPFRDSRMLRARKMGLGTEFAEASIVSEQWLELEGTITDGTNSVVIPYVDAGGDSVTLSAAPDPDEVIITGVFSDVGMECLIGHNTGDATTSQITVRSSISNHGGVEIGVRVKKNT